VFAARKQNNNSIILETVSDLQDPLDQDESEADKTMRLENETKTELLQRKIDELKQQKKCAVQTENYGAAAEMKQVNIY